MKPLYHTVHANNYEQDYNTICEMNEPPCLVGLWLVKRKIKRASLLRLPVCFHLAINDNGGQVGPLAPRKCLDVLVLKLCPQRRAQLAIIEAIHDHGVHSVKYKEILN